MSGPDTAHPPEAREKQMALMNVYIDSRLLWAVGPREVEDPDCLPVNLDAGDVGAWWTCSGKRYTWAGEHFVVSDETSG